MLLSIFLVTVVMIVKPFTSIGQVEKAKQSMLNIYAAYDSLKFLSFDVDYLYDSDTLQGNFTHDKLKGSYALNGKNVVYKLGDIDFMQNDSLFIAVYNKEKFMIVSNPQQTNTGTILPMRAQIDSLFKSAAANYIVTVTETKKNSVIEMVAKDSLQPFNKFIITYNKSNYYLLSLQYFFIGKTDIISDKFEDAEASKILAIPRRKSLRIQFSNYNFNTASAENFDANNYIFYDQNMCKPTAKYSEFKLYNSRLRN